MANEQFKAVQFIVYDVHGSPFPKKALVEIEEALLKTLDSYGLVMTVVKE